MSAPSLTPGAGVSGVAENLVADVSACERALADRSTRLSPVTPDRLEALQLNAEEGYVVSRIDGALSVNDLLVICGLPEEQALRVLLNLLLKGALIPAAPASRPHSRPSTPPQQSSYGRFVFNLRELQEDVDLDQEKKKQILFLFHNVDQMSHYRLLGVPATASPGEIRKAYLERSKEMHPDSFFRKNLGNYKGRIEQIFRRIKGAHDLLMDPESRSKYDREGKHFTKEEIADVSKRQIEELEMEKRARARRDRLLRAKGFARLTMARELVSAGNTALKDGNVKEAIHNYQLAIEVDPRLEDAKNKLSEARRVANVQRADAAVEQAQRAEVDGNTELALTLLKSAVEVDPSNPKTQEGLAAALFKTQSDFAEARFHARRAWELGNRTAGLRVLTGEILLAMGQKKAARAEFQAAADMGDARAKNLLKKV